MLRLQILNLLPKITVISFAKQATNLSIHLHNTDVTAHTSPQVSLEGSCRNIFISACLSKYGRKSGAQDGDTDSEDETETGFKDERDSKVIKTKVNSLRADLLLKVGLGMARK